jgi:hypothetical protein
VISPSMPKAAEGAMRVAGRVSRESSKSFMLEH